MHKARLALVAAVAAVVLAAPAAVSAAPPASDQASGMALLTQLLQMKHDALVAIARNYRA